jgi:hypothetical protein
MATFETTLDAYSGTTDGTDVDTVVFDRGIGSNLYVINRDDSNSLFVTFGNTLPPDPVEDGEGVYFVPPAGIINLGSIPKVTPAGNEDVNRDVFVKVLGNSSTYTIAKGVGVNEVTLNDGGASPTSHNSLSNRDAADSHPYTAITGLGGALADAALPKLIPIRTDSGSTVALEAGDLGKTVLCTNGGATVAEVADDLAVGWWCEIVAYGATTVVTVAGEDDMTVVATPSAVTEDRYSVLRALVVSSNVCHVTGRGVEP